RRTCRPRSRRRWRPSWPTSRAARSRSRRTSRRSSDAMGEQQQPLTVESGPAPAGLHLLQMQGIRKSFGPVVALDGVDFEVGAREVHGLLGGNGAGKTTLMNVLYGLYRPDAGVVRLDGAEVTIRAPRDA